MDSDDEQFANRGGEALDIGEDFDSEEEDDDLDDDQEEMTHQAPPPRAAQ